MQTSNLIYDKIAKTYGFTITNSKTNTLKMDLLLKHTTDSDDVLDIGCANGLYAIPLSGKCKSLTAIDINDKMISLFQEKISNEKISNIKVINHDARDISRFHPETFNLIYSYSTLLLVPDVNKVFDALPSILSKGGKLIIDITGKFNLSQRYWRKWYKKQGHNTFNTFSLSSIKKKLLQAGFEINELHGLGFCDQWKYLPIIKHIASKLTFVDKIFHSNSSNDLDYVVSNLFVLRNFANRWIIVASKE